MLKFRKATISDMDIYFNWANEEEVRKNSYQSNSISFENHVKWFENKLISPQTLLLIFEDEKNNAIGQVRIETENEASIVGISIDSAHRGKGYAIEMLKQASAYYFSLYPKNYIIAYIKKDNFASYKAFVSAGYELLDEVEEVGILSYKLIKKNVSFPE